MELFGKAESSFKTKFIPKLETNIYTRQQTATNNILLHLIIKFLGLLYKFAGQAVKI